MMAMIFNFQAAQRTKQLRQPTQAITFPTDDRSHGFYPEMGEVRNPTKPILSHYVYNSYSIQWADADDQTVRSLIKKLGIRPKYQGIEHVQYGAKGYNWQKSPFGISGYYKALITMPAYGKLVDAGVVSTETLLD